MNRFCLNNHREETFRGLGGICSTLNETLMHFLLQLKSNLNVFYQLAGSCVPSSSSSCFLWTAVEAAAAVSLCRCMLLRSHRWPPAACWFVGLFGCMKTTDGSVCSSASIKTVRKTRTPSFHHLHKHIWWFLSSGSQNVSKCGFWCKNCSFFNMSGLIRTIIALMSARFIVGVLEPRAETQTGALIQTEQQTEEK